jgi:hypothetical protein
VFEDWPVAMFPPTRRVVDPPQPVCVDLSRFIVNPDDAFRRDEIALRVKNEGLDLRGQVPGHLHAWAQSTHGGCWRWFRATFRQGMGRADSQ